MSRTQRIHSPHLSVSILIFKLIVIAIAIDRMKRTKRRILHLGDLGFLPPVELLELTSFPIKPSGLQCSRCTGETEAKPNQRIDWTKNRKRLGSQASVGPQTKLMTKTED
jgi:hypothetical protein